MKGRFGMILSVCIILLGVDQAESQGFTTKGTDFWLSFMENLREADTTGADRMKVYITTDYLAATGVVSVPLAGWSSNYTVPPNSTLEVVIPTDIVMCSESDSIENKGVHVTSDVPVSVYQLNYIPYTSDANIVIPTTSLGKRYRVTTYQATNSGFDWIRVSVSELVVVAAYDSTVIRIVPKCNTQGGHGANVPFTITLNKGQVYPIKAYPSTVYSLTGTLIEIDTNVSNNCKTFAVFSGNLCAFVPGDSCCCNHICEQMMPINTWGKEYITVPLKTRASDVFRFVGQQAGTIFTINGGPPNGLNAGGYYEEDISQPSYISSNFPLSVAQFSKSGGTDGNEYSDPFMIMLSPLEQSIKRIVFNSFVTPVIQAYYLNIVTRSAYTNLVVLDGINIDTAFHVVAGNPLYSYAQVTVNQGNHILSSDSGLIANIYGYGWYETYGYIAGATVKNLSMSYTVTTPAGTFQYYDLQDTICRNTPLTFTATNSTVFSNYTWDFGDGSPLTYGQNVTHTYLAPGNYVIRFYFQKSGICGLDSIIWSVNIKCCNEPPAITGNSSICIGLTITLKDTSTFNPDATYTWDFDGGTVISGSGQGPYELNWASPGTYTVWLYSSVPNCTTDSTSYTVVVNPVPTATFDIGPSVCPGGSTTVNYTGNASVSANYQWIFEGGLPGTGDSLGPYSVILHNPGIHYFTLTVTEGGCAATSTDSTQVYQLPVPQFTINPPTAFVGEALIQFNDYSVNAYTWLWNFGDSTSPDNSSTDQSPSHYYENQGEYHVWLYLTSFQGCEDSASQIVYIEDFNTFYIPNAFTPNGNGLNETFQPYSTGMNYTLYIFNRWGEQLFKGENQGWDGTYKGSVVKADVYSYMVIYTFRKEKPKLAAGKVLVIK